MAVELLKRLPKAIWKSAIAAAGTTAPAAASLAFLEELREGCGKIEEDERARLAEEAAKARVEDLERDMEGAGVENEELRTDLAQLTQRFAHQVATGDGQLPTKDDLKSMADEVIRHMDRQHEQRAKEHLRLEWRVANLLDGMENWQRHVDRVFRLLDAREQQTDEAQEFERAYLAYLADVYGRLRMLGVREMRDVRQTLSIAYVSLRLTSGDPKEDEPLTLDAKRVLLKEPVLTIRGPAGSGKTTLLHWVLTQCARTDDEENPWRGGVPFFIPLRKLAADAEGQPSLEHFVDYGKGLKEFTHEPPNGWVAQVLEQQRGVLLIDAVDELPRQDRPGFWDWLSQFVHDYPGNRIVVTSRPFPEREPKGEGAGKLWDPPRQFTGVELEDMTDADIAQFIANWHDAVLEHETDGERRAELEKRRDELPTKLRDPANRRVRELCRSPLLCGLVCALHWHEEGYLPTRRVDLYERCCALLIDERDRKRDLPKPEEPYRFLSRDDKEMLLQRLAYAMMRNLGGGTEKRQVIECSREQALEWIQPNLPGVDDPRARECRPERVLDQILIERTGLVREPSRGYVDFPHRSFQEYLAACAAGALCDAGDLAARASDDLWRETIILAAGTKAGGIPFGNQLLRDLFKRGTDSGAEYANRLTCLALAVACLETARQPDPKLREDILAHLKPLIPPRSADAAQALAAAGDRVVELLPYSRVKKRDYTERTAAACARTVALVGTDAAVRELRQGYGTDPRQPVLAEACRAVEPLELPAVLQAVKDRGEVPPFARPFVTDLAHLAQLTGLTRLILGDPFDACTQVTDLAPLAELSDLQQLFLFNCGGVTDAGLAHLAGLTALEALVLDGTQVTDAGLAHLAELTALKVLSLSGTQVTDDGLAHLAGLTALEQLFLERTQVTDDGLAHLAGLTALEGLSLSGTQVTDAGLAHLAGLTALEGLDLNDTQVGDAGLAHLAGLTALEGLLLTGTQVTDAGVRELEAALPECEIIR